MATIVKDKTRKNYFIKLTGKQSPTGKQVKITCPDMNKRQVKHVCSHVENLVSSNTSGLPLDQATCEWVASVEGPIRNRLENLGLIEHVHRVLPISLVTYMTDFITNRSDISDSTRRIYNRSLHFTVIGRFKTGHLWALQNRPGFW